MPLPGGSGGPPTDPRLSRPSAGFRPLPGGGSGGPPTDPRLSRPTTGYRLRPGGGSGGPPMGPRSWAVRLTPRTARRTTRS